MVYLHDLPMLLLELLQAVQHNKLDVVVALGHKQLAVAVGGRTNGRGRLGQGHQRDSTLVHHSGAAAL